MKIYLSIRPRSIGGGSNTFSGLFRKWAKKRGHKVVRSCVRADLAIVIAHLSNERELEKAKRNGCRIIHRLDEYFEKNEDKVRQEKHSKIIRLNGHADLTVFQSWFVQKNVYPHIQPENFVVIHNGGDPEKFSPAKKPGKYIGHVTWGVDTKKRLDLLYEFIRKYPEEQFLLIGRHREAEIDFALPNVKIVGKVRQSKLPKYYRMMKFLYFPSEKDPCPNTVIESILCGVPVCYNKEGGTVELVDGIGMSDEIAHVERVEKDETASAENKQEDISCGLPLERSEEMTEHFTHYRNNCFSRSDLSFNRVFEQYIAVGRRLK